MEDGDGSDGDDDDDEDAESGDDEGAQLIPAWYSKHCPNLCCLSSKTPCLLLTAPLLTCSAGDQR